MPKGKARKIQTLKTQVVKETVTEEKVTNEETTVKIETVEKEADNTMTSDSQSLKRKHSEDDEPQESGSSSDDTTTKSSGSSSLADRMAKLKELKKRRVCFYLCIYKCCVLIRLLFRPLRFRLVTDVIST